MGLIHSRCCSGGALRMPQTAGNVSPALSFWVHSTVSQVPEQEPQAETAAIPSSCPHLFGVAPLPMGARQELERNSHPSQPVRHGDQDKLAHSRMGHATLAWSLGKPTLGEQIQGIKPQITHIPGKGSAGSRPPQHA